MILGSLSSSQTDVPGRTCIFVGWRVRHMPVSLCPLPSAPSSPSTLQGPAQVRTGLCRPQNPRCGTDSDSTARVVGKTDIFSSLSLVLNSPDTADHMGSYGPAFYQSYDASGQFTYEFDGEQLFSVELKKREAAWRLPEFGDFTHFDPQGGLASIAVIKAHLDVLVERSNRTRAVNSRFLALPLTPQPSVRQGRPREASAPPPRPLSALVRRSQNLRLGSSALSLPGGSRSFQTRSTPVPS